jgi:hypothetical protein
MRRRATARLHLEVDVGERLPAGFADDEAGLLLVDRPARREAAAGCRALTGPTIRSPRRERAESQFTRGIPNHRDGDFDVVTGRVRRARGAAVRRKSRLKIISTLALGYFYYDGTSVGRQQPP